MEKIKITQVKSSIGTIPVHRKTLKALGLKKIGSARVHNKSKEILGMIRSVNYLISVEKAQSMSNKTNRIKPSTAFGAARKTKKSGVDSSNLIPIPKGAKKERKRIGQGPGSGMGKTSTRGQR